VWIWSQERPDRLGRRTARLLLAPQHVNRVCTISTLEIARLLAAGHIALSMPLRDWIEQSLVALAAEKISIEAVLQLPDEDATNLPLRRKDSSPGPGWAAGMALSGRPGVAANNRASCESFGNYRF